MQTGCWQNRKKGSTARRLGEQPSESTRVELTAPHPFTPPPSEEKTHLGDKAVSPLEQANPDVLDFSRPSLPRAPRAAEEECRYSDCSYRIRCYPFENQRGLLKVHSLLEPFQELILGSTRCPCACQISILGSNSPSPQ